MNELVAAAILVQTIFNSSERLRAELDGQVAQGPAPGADFLRPWLHAAFAAVVKTKQGV